MRELCTTPSGKKLMETTDRGAPISPDEPASYGNYMFVDGEVIIEAGRIDELGDLEVNFDREASTELPGGMVHLRGVEAGLSIPELVDELLERDVTVTPHHVLSLGNHVQFGPYDAPRPVDGDPLWKDEGFDAAKILREATGNGPNVVVIDTGVLKPEIAGADLHAGRGLGYWDEEPPPQPVNNNPNLSKYVAHGTFVAAHVIIQCPDAKVHVFRPEEICMDQRGRAFVMDEELARTLDRAFQRLGQSTAVLSLSLFGPRHGKRNGQSTTVIADPLPHTRAALARWHDSGAEIVAAAGNTHRSDEHFPGAYDFVCAVGADRRNGHHAPWSNSGRWVNTWELGERTVSAYLNDGAGSEVRVADNLGAEQIEQGPWDGYAAWSGTSFATPRVAGQIAAGQRECDPNKPAD